jgi:tRNA threonylcarbamoyladenosine biosynthesis protein TsaB
MLVLALDTTTRQGSVALAREGGVVAVYAGDAAITHGERLPGDLIRLLEGQDLRVADVDLFSVASGPGSLTGLRIGIATMQGFALANGKSLVGISALDAIDDAVQTSDEKTQQPSSLRVDNEVAIWMDAGRGQVFSARYRSGDVVEPALVDAPADILSRWLRERTRVTLFAGDGALAYRDLIRSVVPDAQVVEPVPPLAPSVARLAERYLNQHGPSEPDAIRPVYVRRSDVELARDRAAVSAEAPAALRRDGRP